MDKRRNHRGLSDGPLSFCNALHSREKRTQSGCGRFPSSRCCVPYCNVPPGFPWDHFREGGTDSAHAS